MLNRESTNQESTNITLEEYAALSLDVYNSKEESSPPEGWIRYLDTDHLYKISEENIKSYNYKNNYGYFGALYYKEYPNKDVNVVVAHRGTANLENIVDDLKLFFGNAHLNFSDAAFYCFKRLLLIFINDKNINFSNVKNIHNTGHSLGSIASDFISMIVQRNVYRLSTPILSITFENPGSKNYLLEIAEYVCGKLGEDIKIALMNTAKSNCYTYLANPNMINTNNEQLNNCYRLTDLEFDYTYCGFDNSLFCSIFPSIPPDLHVTNKNKYDSFIGNSYYMITYTLDQHRIGNICKYFQEGKRVDLCTNPSGFQKGYIEYLNPERKKYWNRYIDACWITYRYLREKYTNNKQEFSIDFYKVLLNTYEMSNQDKKEDIKATISSSSLSLFNVNREISEFVMLNNEETNEPSRCSLM